MSSLMWRYYRTEEDSGDCKAEILALDPEIKAAVILLVDRQQTGELLEGQELSVDEVLCALVMSPPQPRHGIVYTTIDDGQPYNLGLCVFRLEHGQVPNVDQQLAIERLARWSKRR